MIERGMHLMKTWDQIYPDDIWTYIGHTSLWEITIVYGKIHYFYGHFQ